MNQFIAHIALVVRDYDESIAFIPKNWASFFWKTPCSPKPKDGWSWLHPDPGNVHSCWQKPPVRNNKTPSATKPGVVFFFFFIQMIFTGTTGIWKTREYGLSDLPQKKSMARWLFLKICMATSGTWSNPMILISRGLNLGHPNTAKNQIGCRFSR